MTLFLAGLMLVLVASGAHGAATDYLGIVQRLYMGYYQRPADPDGLLYWAGQLDMTGGNVNAIMAAFATSPESLWLHGRIDSGTITNVVDGIYMAFFGRPADAEGKAYYVESFLAGRASAAGIALDILNGAQGLDRISVENKLAAAALFTETAGLFETGLVGEAFSVAGRMFLAQVTSDPATIPSGDETAQFVVERAGASAQVTLAWDPVMEPELAGYRIYYGQVSGAYRWYLDVGKVTSCRVAGLSPGVRYYFAATAYDASGFESDYSEEVTYQP